MTATLAQAIARLAPALKKIGKFDTPSITYTDRVLSARNLLCCARVMIDLELPDFHCRADPLRRVVNDRSRVMIDPQWITVKNNQTTFRFAQTAPDKMIEWLPPEGDGVMVTDEFATSAKMVAAFASDNAIYPWAHCVVACASGLIATNNIALACVPTPAPFALSMPLDLVAQLKGGQIMIAGPHLIALSEGDFVLNYRRLSKETPARVFELAAHSKPCTKRIEDLQTILNERIRGAKTLAFEPGTIRFEAGDGYASEHQFDCDFTFKTTIKNARLLARFATHVDASQAPARLLFSCDGDVPMVGVLAAGIHR
jgi:hypothetical protein